jgi:hypothetical protein
MTQFIDRDDVKAIQRKMARELCAMADAVEATVPELDGVKDEGAANAVLERMVQGLIAKIDAIERRVLLDLDALTIKLD